MRRQNAKEWAAIYGEEQREGEKDLKSLCARLKYLQRLWKKTGGWARFIALCYIWKILVIILHFIMGSPAKPEDHKNS